MTTKTKEIPTAIYDILNDTNISEDFRIAIATALKVSIPDDHMEDIRDNYDLSMLKEIDEEDEQKANYFNNMEEPPMEDIK